MASQAWSNTLKVCQSNPLKLKEDILHLKVIEPLVKRVGPKQVMIPLLVKNWEVSDDGIKYRFILRENIKFHGNRYFKPTRHLDTNDVKFSLEKNESIRKNFKSINIHSPTEFTIILTQKDDNFLEKLTSVEAGIHSYEYAMFISSVKEKQKAKILMDNPFGTGPFKLISQSESVAKFTAYSNYHLGNVQYKELIIKYVLGDAKRTQLLALDQCDIAYRVDLNSFFKSDTKDYSLLPTAHLKSIYLGFNAKKALINDPKIQTGLLAQLDPVELNKEFYYSQANFHLKGPVPSLLQSNMTVMEVKKLPTMKFARIDTPSSSCPQCRTFTGKLAKILGQAGMTTVNLDRSDLPNEASEKLLSEYDLILSENNHYQNFDFYKLLDLNLKIAVNNKLKNFYHTEEGTDDLSLIEFIGPSKK